MGYEPEVRKHALGSDGFRAGTFFSTAAQAVVPCSERLPVATPLWIRLVKTIAPDLRLRPRPCRRSAASRSSRAFPICSPMVARAEAPRQDARPGSLRNSQVAGDR